MAKLNERHKKILWAIIQSHIDLNIPVGSNLVTKRFPIGISPATVRNTMAALERYGYIAQPHKSAGRIPTEKGYRFYVDLLMDEQPLPLNSAISIELSSRLKKPHDDNTQLLIKEAAHSLSILSQYLAIATPLEIRDMVLQHLRFIKYENKKVLTILVSDSGTIKNRLVELDKEYSQHELDRATHYLNSRFSGLSIRKVRSRIAYEVYKEKVICDQLVENFVTLCKDITYPGTEDITLNSLSGTSNLPDFANLGQIKEILKAIENKQFMLRLLQQISSSRGTRVIVGMEKIMPAMKELSMVISTYNNKQNSSGAIGIIGPTRMNYKKLIPIVDHTAKAITKILSGN